MQDKVCGIYYEYLTSAYKNVYKKNTYKFDHQFL